MCGAVRMQGRGNVQTQGVLTSAFRFWSASSLMSVNAVACRWCGTCGKRKLHAFSDSDHTTGRSPTASLAKTTRRWTYNVHVEPGQSAEHVTLLLAAPGAAVRPQQPIGIGNGSPEFTGTCRLGLQQATSKPHATIDRQQRSP